jgi:hypothetical protein
MTFVSSSGDENHEFVIFFTIIQELKPPFSNWRAPRSKYIVHRVKLPTTMKATSAGKTRATNLNFSPKQVDEKGADGILADAL